MRGLLTAAALVGALVTGGLPVLALSLTADETASDTATPASPDADEQQSEAPGQKAGRDKQDAKKPPKAAKPQEDGLAGEPGWARRSEVPPGWAKNHGGQRPYGWAVREWAHCTADAAASQQDPRTTCGDKPAKPAKPAKAPKPDKAEKPKDASKPGKPASPKNATKPSALTT